MCAYLKPKTCQNVRVFAVVLAVKFSLNPNLQSKTSLKIKFTSIFVDG